LYHSDIANERQIFSSLSDRPIASTKPPVKQNSSLQSKNKRQNTVDDSGIEMVLSTAEMIMMLNLAKLKLLYFKQLQLKNEMIRQ